MEQLKVTQVKSCIGRLPGHIKTAEALGLGKIGKTRVHKSTPAILGMIKKVGYLLKVEKVL